MLRGQHHKRQKHTANSVKKSASSTTKVRHITTINSHHRKTVPHLSHATHSSPTSSSKHLYESYSTSSLSHSRINSRYMSSNPEEAPQKEVNTEQPVSKRQQKKNQGGKKANDAPVNSLAVQAKKSEDFSRWYADLVVRSELIEYYDISGCYILRPWAYEIWEQIQSFLDGEFKKLGVKNTYFPMLVPKRNLEKEEDHVEGFSAEVAWVTHSGSTKLEEPVAIRPTSETIMYPAFSKWITSHRDLPLKLNQWCNVLRWEFKDATPFIRSREFLWQEGHTAHKDEAGAAEEVLQILDIYARAYEEILACSVVKGKKTEHEKFAGGHYTTTVEGFIAGSGRAIQAATSHCLGTNFSKMFGIQYIDENNQQQYAWQNSWGFTTRSIGVLLMTHSDDKGLVLPPRIAPIQVVFVPIYKGDNKPLIDTAMYDLAKQLESRGVRVKVDDSMNHNPGFKYNHWELKGVPLRIEIGGRDLDNKSCIMARRDTGEKATTSWDNFADTIVDKLDVIQNDLRTASKKAHMDAIKQVTTWDEFVSNLADGHLGLLPWCGNTPCELDMKKRSAEDLKARNAPRQGAAKSLCIPFEQPTEDATQNCCVGCDQKATQWTLFGHSY